MAEETSTQGSRFADALVAMGVVSAVKAAALLAIADGDLRTFRESIERRNLVTEEQMTRALAEAFGLAYLDLSTVDVPPEVVGCLREETCRLIEAIPIAYEGGEVTLAIANPAPTANLSVTLGRDGFDRYRLQVADGEKIREALALAAQAGAFRARAEGHSPWADRDTLARCLAVLARSRPPAPETMSTGAMCYMSAPIEGTSTVVCSECGTRTMREISNALADLAACERLAQAARRAHLPLDCRIDSAEFCSSCRKGLEVRGAPRPWLVLRLTGIEGERRVTVDSEAMEALVALLDGHDRIEVELGEETALVRSLPALRQILGIGEGDGGDPAA